MYDTIRKSREDSRWKLAMMMEFSGEGKKGRCGGKNEMDWRNGFSGSGSRFLVTD